MLSEQSRGNIDKSATVQQAHIVVKNKFWLSKIISFQKNLGANEYRKDRRINGLQLPLHPLQLVGWITLIVFVLASYLLIIPTFHEKIIRLSLYIVISILLLIHTVAHIAALIIDPADIELRKISTQKVVPEFDRTKHSHVIENGRCHLCNIKTTSQRTKHCSVCNKCVATFDHHCHYLNSCISKTRNYVPFLMCVASAVGAVLVILIAAITQIVLFYTNPSWLNLNWFKSYDEALQNPSLSPSSSSVEVGGGGVGDDEKLTSMVEDFSTQINQFLNSTPTLNETLGGSIENSTLVNSTANENIFSEGIGLYSAIYLGLIGLVAILAAITTGLLLHLFFFHLYICYLGLTTYEYIRNHRQTLTTSNTNGPSINMKEKQKKFFICSKINTADSRHRPKTLFCCNFPKIDPENLQQQQSSYVNLNSASISQKAFYLCTLVEETTIATASSNDIDAASIQYQNGEDEDVKEGNLTSKTLHCCSEFAHVTKSQNGIEKIVQYKEQCAFCTFRIKSLSRKLEHQQKRCIKNNISKHHRWRRKWNCCSNVPNSPEDVQQNTASNQIISSTIHPSNYVQIEIPIENCANINLSQNNLNINHHSPLNNKKITEEGYENFSPFHRNHHRKDSNETDNKNQSIHHQYDDMKSISTISAACSNENNNESSSTAAAIVASCKINNANNNPKKLRSKLVRPWPVRLRYVFRMINRYRRPRGCRSGGISMSSLKQNQVRPITMMSGTVEPEGTSSSDNNGDVYTISNNNAVIPSAPAPNRRKLKNSTDLKDLADSLSIIQSSSTTSTTTATVQQVPTIQNIRRHQRRKNFLRNKSPTLSPIHESGFSNPASPQLACKHACSGSISSLGNNGSFCGKKNYFDK